MEDLVKVKYEGIILRSQDPINKLSKIFDFFGVGIVNFDFNTLLTDVANQLKS